MVWWHGEKHGDEIHSNADNLLKEHL